HGTADHHAAAVAAKDVSVVTDDGRSIDGRGRRVENKRWLEPLCAKDDFRLLLLGDDVVAFLERGVVAFGGPEAPWVVRRTGARFFDERVFGGEFVWGALARGDVDGGFIAEDDGSVGTVEPRDVLGR